MWKSTPSMLIVPLIAGLSLGGAMAPDGAAPGEATGLTGPDLVEGGDVVVERGTEIRLELRNRLSTSDSRSGDRVRARVSDPVIAGRIVAIPEDALVRGRVTSVRDPDRGERAGIEISFDEVVVDGRSYDLRASLVDADPQKSGDPNSGEKAKKIGGGAAAGALLGALISDDDAKGALIGAAAGAATGSAIYAGTRGTKLTLPAGSRITIETDERLRIEGDDR